MSLHCQRQCQIFRTRHALGNLRIKYNCLWNTKADRSSYYEFLRCKHQGSKDPEMFWTHTLFTSSSCKLRASQNPFPPQTLLISMALSSSSSIECAICWARPAGPSSSSSLSVSVEHDEDSTAEPETSDHWLKAAESQWRSAGKCKSCPLCCVVEPHFGAKLVGTGDGPWFPSSLILEQINRWTLATSNAISPCLPRSKRL